MVFKVDRVGIGVSNPSQRLDVNGSCKLAGPNIYLDWHNDQRVISSANNHYRQGYHFQADTRVMRLFSTTGESDSGGAIAFSTRIGAGSSDTDYGTERMRIDSSGNVGIGTGSPACKLDIASEDVMIRGNTPSLNFSEGTTGMDGAFRIHYDGANEDDNDNFLAVQYGTSFASTSLHMTLGGNVGIGTTSPDEKLHIYANDSSHTQLLLRNNESTARTGIRIKNSAGQDFTLQHIGGSSAASNAAIIENFSTVNGGIDFYNKGDGKYTFHTTSSNTVRLRILNNGNVGIGTASPLNILHLSSGNTSLDASGSATFDEYSLIIHNTRDSGATNTELGLCFNHYDSSYPDSSRTPGAAITHERVDSWSKGKLHFKTKSGNTETGSCDTRMTIDADGNVGIGVTSPSHPLTVQETTTNTNTVTYPLAIRAISSGTVGNGFGAGIRFQCERRDTDDYQSLAGSVEVYGAGGLPGTSDLWNMRFGVRNNDTAVTPMTLKYNGNVGIGDSDPGYKLSVNGTSMFTDTVNIVNNDANAYAHLEMGGTAGAYIDLKSPNTDDYDLRFITTGSGGSILVASGSDGINIDSSGNVSIIDGSFRVSGGNTSTFGSDGLLHINSRSTQYGSETVALQTTIDGRALTDSNPGTHGGENRNVIALQPDGGYVGVGTISPSYKLHVAGAIYATGNITAYSDRRAKSNIEKIKNPLEKINKISGYTYTMKTEDNLDKRYTGLIAQEVLEILPEAVAGSEDTQYSLAYGNMVGILVEAIKELKLEIDELKRSR